MDSEKFDSVVANLYRAAMGEAGWDEALESVRLAFGARCAPVQIMDIGTGSLVAAYPGGPDMERPILNYIKEYNQCDPRAQIVLKRPFGEWVHCSDHHDEEFVKHDRFYREFLPSYGSRFVSGVVIPLDNRTLSIFGIQRSANRGPLSYDEREFARRIGSHLRDALLGYERIRKLAAQALAGHTLLETFSYPMWLFDVDRFIYFSNAACEREYTDKNSAIRAGRRFDLENNLKSRELAEKISRLQWGGEYKGTDIITVKRPANSIVQWLHLSLLVPGKVLGAFGDRPQILATLFDSKQFGDFDTFALSNVFDLTPMEAKVASQIGKGMTPAEITASNGVRISTVRSQLRSILMKLGVSRQSDIVRLLSQGGPLWHARAMP